MRSCLTDVGKLDRANRVDRGNQMRRVNEIHSVSLVGNQIHRDSPEEGSGRKRETSVAPVNRMASRMVNKVRHLVLNRAKAVAVNLVVVPQISLVLKWASSAEPLRDSQMVSANRVDKAGVVADETHGLLRRSRLLMQIKTA